MSFRIESPSGRKVTCNTGRGDAVALAWKIACEENRFSGKRHKPVKFIMDDVVDAYLWADHFLDAEHAKKLGKVY